MSHFYDRIYRVSKWVNCIDLNEKHVEYVRKALGKKEFSEVKWPSYDFQEKIKEFAGQGYYDQVNQPMPFFLDLTLSLRAMVEITRKYNGNAQLNPYCRYNQLCNNRIEKDEDYVRLADSILLANDDISLSQVFDTLQHGDKLLLSFNANTALLHRISTSVVTVGVGSKYTVDLENLNQKDAIAALQQAFRGA